MVFSGSDLVSIISSEVLMKHCGFSSLESSSRAVVLGTIMTAASLNMK